MQSASRTDRLPHGLDVETVRSSAKAKAAGAIEWNTDQLFGAAQEVGIRHDGQLYRLRRTRLGKLILTK
jgi:hemin uptake protein HemP